MKYRFIGYTLLSVIRWHEVSLKSSRGVRLKEQCRGKKRRFCEI